MVKFCTHIYEIHLATERKWMHLVITFSRENFWW